MQKFTNDAQVKTQYCTSFFLWAMKFVWNIHFFLVLQNLKKAALWAKVNKVPFPKIDESVYNRKGMKEVYVFEEPRDPSCPIILLFPMVNLTFKNFKKPGKYTSVQI